MQKELQEKSRCAIVAAVQLPSVTDVEFEASLAELRDLTKTLGFKIVHTFTQKRSSFDFTAYLGVGKREEIRQFVNVEAEDAERQGEQQAALPDADSIDALLVDHEISPSQARNLEKEVGCEVLERTMVILEIFHRNARSPAARAQVEIARLGYMAPRLREKAKLLGPQGRQRSGVGGRGAGESGTELDRRKIRDRIAELKLEIVAMDADRQIQRARRQGRRELANVGLVGYTNTGKSTLMRALTGSDVLVANKLFATLDTTVRALYPEHAQRARRPEEVAKLHQVIVEFFQQDLVEDEIFLPWSAQQMRSEIYANYKVLEERADNEGAFFRIRGEPSVLKRVRERSNQP